MEREAKIEDDMSQEENVSSLDLSITPPLLDNNERAKTPPSSDHSISEHLTTNSASSSVENDRSLHEIEITHQPTNNDTVSLHINEDNKPASLNTSLKSESSVISLNYFNHYANTNGNYHVKGILEEILNDDQFLSDKQRHSNGHDATEGESLVDIFANIDLDDKSLNEKESAMKSTRDYQEIIAGKDGTIAALTNELDSMRELSNSMSTTEYKQLQDELHSKLMEYNSMVVYKDDLIRQLSDSLEQSVVERKEMMKEMDDFKGKIAELEARTVGEKNAEVSELECLKKRTEEYQVEIKHLNELLTAQSESKNVDEMRKELEIKHANEMEELRRYFEKKCADLEKNYSEEVFSQQSRKLSDTSLSSCSEAELKSEEFGAGGDGTTRKNIELIRNELNTLLPNLNALNLDNGDDLRKCEVELKRSNLNLLDNVNTQHLKTGSESKTMEMYEKKIKELSEELETMRNEAKQVAIPSGPVQEVASNNSSGDFEITEVVQSYERRLQEQISLAKIDMLNVLENQIQRLVSDEAEEEDWPEELLQIRDRFAMKYEQMLDEANRGHEDEVNRLKEDHLRVLNGSIERAKRKSEESFDADVIKERDLYKKQASTMRSLLGDLLRYFTQCEDELNATLVDELLASNLEDESVKRVHLTPNVDDLMQLIETNSSFDDSESNNISIELKNELGSCLEKLKTDANAILSLTNVLIQKPSNELHDKLSNERELKEKLMQEMRTAIGLIETLENDKEEYEKRFEEVLQRSNMLESELHQAQQRISELIENGQKEVVSEGYGVGQSTHLDDTMKALTELQETARGTISESRTSADPKLLNLIEELCSVAEKIKEESLKERNDLIQQIEAADKKYKTTQEFLEEQANERELERDEAQKQILQLNNLLKERDKEKVNRAMMSSEVEALESHIQTATRQNLEQSEKLKVIECERNEAIDKIKVLRDIIRELEQQNDTKIKEIDEFSETVDQLQCIIKQQHATIADLKQNPLDNISDAQELRKHINKLENELQQLRLSNELAGSEGAIKQFQLQLYELEICLDKKTRDLELLHQTGPNCSTPPSEDMSIRDVIRPKTPTNLNLDECEVPLQQLARLKEKLVRHSRAEEAAMKRTRDMDMQIYNLKAELDENQHEKECLKKQLQEHLVLISDLQIRLDEQRMRAEHIEKQANTSLETKIYDLRTEIVALQERNQQNNKTIKQLNGIICETQRRVRDLEEELSRQPKEDELIVEMQMEIGKLRMENQKLNEKLIKDSQLVPNLVENIITDKNCDIEKLQKKLDDTEMELKRYYTLNLSRSEMEKLVDLKKGNSSLYDILNEVDQLRRQQSYSICENFNVNPRIKQSPNETQFLTDVELSSIERIGPEHVNYTTEAPLMKPNSTELYKSCEKRVHFEDIDVDLLKKQIVSLESQLKEKEMLVNELTDRLRQLNELETKVAGLERALEQTETTLERATKTYEIEQTQLQADLVQKKVLIEEYLKRIEFLETDSRRKDAMCLNLAKEKVDLEKKVEHKESTDNFLSLDLESARNDYQNLKRKLIKKREHLHGLEQQQAKQEIIIKQLKEQNKTQNDIIKDRECEIEILNEDAKRYQNDLNDLELKLQSLKTEKLNGDKKVSDYNKEITHLNDLVKEKEKIIQQITEDSHKLHENLILIKSKMHETGNIVDLANKLRDEQKKNTDLLEEMQNLKVQLLQQQNAVDVDEITGQLKRELDYSVEIDTNILNAISGQNVDPKSLLEKYQQLQNQLIAMDNGYMVKLSELQSQLEYERFLLQQTQLQDAQLIEQLRLQLDLVVEKRENVRKELSDSSPTEYREPPTKELVEISQLKEENEKLVKRMKLMKQQKQEVESNAKYGKKLLSVEMDRSKSLGNKVEELLENQKELRESLLMHKLQLEERIQEVENKKVLMREMENEKGHLVKQKQQLLDMMKRVNGGGDNNRDLIARSDYLFAKNLKLESVKKSLIWQKRYLMAYLMTHRQHCLITALPHTRIDSKRLRHSSVNRFRSVVFVVITVLRMKYLVKRWNSEARIAQNVNARHYMHITHAVGTASGSNLANFHIGQPVSQQHFVQNQWNPFHEPNMVMGEGDGQRKPFTASSPPTKDTQHALANVNLDPLRAPKLLAQFADRFDQIQEKLGIALEMDDVS